MKGRWFAFHLNGGQSIGKAKQKPKKKYFHDFKIVQCKGVSKINLKNKYLLKKKFMCFWWTYVTDEYGNTKLFESLNDVMTYIISKRKKDKLI